MEADIAANYTEDRKGRKYSALVEAHKFESIAVETLGVYGESTGVSLRAISRRLVVATGEPREANWVRQNLSIAVQRVNLRSVFSQSVGRGFGRLGESSFTQPLTLFLREFPFPLREYIIHVFDFQVLDV